jgi:hypothetical protein
MKNIFDKRAKEKNFITRDLVMKWDAIRKAKGKHGKFDNLWVGPCNTPDP